MPGFLAGLIGRARGSESRVSPRRPSTFEPPASTRRDEVLPPDDRPGDVLAAGDSPSLRSRSVFAPPPFDRSTGNMADGVSHNRERGDRAERVAQFPAAVGSRVIVTRSTATAAQPDGGESRAIVDQADGGELPVGRREVAFEPDVAGTAASERLPAGREAEPVRPHLPRTAPSERVLPEPEGSPPAPSLTAAMRDPTGGSPATGVPLGRSASPRPTAGSAAAAALAETSSAEAARPAGEPARGERAQAPDAPLTPGDELAPRQLRSATAVVTPRPTDPGDGTVTPPEVRITIGRVEVRASQEPKSPEVTAWKAPVLSLEEFLRRERRRQ